MSLLLLTCAVCLLLSTPAYAVDKGNFKSCDQSSFCRWATIRITACAALAYGVGRAHARA